MNPRKLQHEQAHAQEQTTLQQAVEQNAALEFKTPEEALRHDAARTELPPAIAERLRQSIAAEPTPPTPRPWWKRMLGN